MRFVVATSATNYWLPQAECFAQALRNRGHEALVPLASVDEAAVFKPDVLLCLGTGESPEPFLDAAGAPTNLLYLIESVPTLTETDKFTRNKLEIHRHSFQRFDRIFVHTPRSIPMLAAEGAPPAEALIWPHFPTLFTPLPNVERDVDLLFVGTVSPYRKQVLKRIAERFQVAVSQEAFHADSAAVYARARIALNIHFTPLRNLECRVSEVLGCGAFLLTEALDPEDVFLDGQHLATFDEHNLFDQIERYLHNAPKREEIARAGHAEVQKYTIEKQIERIIRAAEEVQRGKGASVSGRGSPALPPPAAGAGTTANPGSVGGGTAAGDAAASEFILKLNERPYTIKFPKSHSIDYMLQELFVKKVYPFLPFLQQLPGVILDIGANIGCASILFRASYPEAPIIAFEPDRLSFSFLQANTAPLANIRLFNHGLYNRDATAKLYQGQGTSTTNSMSASIHNTGQCEEIRLRRISTFLAEQAIERIRLLKIDTEGAEVPILQDIEHFLDRIDAIFLEYHSESDRLEIDRMLSARFVLCNAEASLAHRGALAYVAKGVIAAHTNFNKYEISRPNI